MYMADRAVAAAEGLNQSGGADDSGRKLRTVLRCVDALKESDMVEGGGKSLEAVAMWKLYPWEWLIHESLGQAFTPPG